MVELGRVWDPKARKYIRIVEGGVASSDYAHYDDKKRIIHLNSRKSYRSDDRYMDTCIHEALHAAFPSLSEDIIVERTPILKRLLKKMGIQPTSLE